MSLPSARVLGVDPGSRSLGWSVVVREHGRYRLLAGGAVRPDPERPMGERLDALYQGLRAAIAEGRPDCAALEAIFSHRSAASALVLGQARGVALLALAHAGLPVYEYNASTVKLSVAGSGRADKAQVGRMVALLLGGAPEGPHDVADAAAIAITHHAHAGRLAALGAR